MIDLSVPAQAWGRCLLESQAYIVARKQSTNRLMYVRVTGREYPGREHWAVFSPDPTDPTDGVVVDLTARQFGPNAPYPWNGTVNEWLDDCCEWLQDGLDVAVFGHFTDENPVWMSTWVRDDIEPGPLPYSALEKTS